MAGVSRFLKSNLQSSLLISLTVVIVWPALVVHQRSDYEAFGS